MKKIETPSWQFMGWRDKAADVSDEQIKLWREETDKYNKEISELASEYNKKWLQLIALAKELYGERSKEVSYLNAHGPDPCYRLSYDFERIIEDAKKEKELKERKEKDAVERNELLAKAVLWLKQRGKELGKDYQASDAIMVANDISFEEEIEKMKKLGEYISFSGDDNCENCKGWDGENHSCQCGNRRVSWESGGDFEKPYIYAEAY